MNTSYTFKLFRVFICHSFLCGIFNQIGTAQIITHTPNTPISATIVGQNTSANFVTRYVLCDNNGAILFSNAKLPFTNVAVGVYNLFSINYDTTVIAPNLAVGNNINTVSGGCVAKSTPLKIGVSDCSNLTGNLVFKNGGFNSSTGFTQKYILSDEKQKIIALSDSTKFSGLANGIYNVYALNYETSKGINNLSVGNNINLISGGCFSMSNAVGFVVCVPVIAAPTIVKNISLTIPQDTAAPKTICTTMSNQSSGVSYQLSNCGAPQKGTATTSLSNNQLCISYKPNAGQSGTDTVCVKVCNVGGCDSIKVPIVITPSALNVSCNNFTGIITFTQIGNNTSGVFTQRYALTDSLGKILKIGTTKNFTVTQSGLYKVYAVNYDSTQSISGLAVNQNISTVTGVCLNTSGALLFRVCLTAPPIITKPVTITVPQDTTSSKQVCTTVTNPDNASLTLSSCGAPAHGSSTSSITGNQLCLTYKPTAGYSGPDTVCVKLCDAGGCDSVKVPVSVTPTPIAPPVIPKLISIVTSQDTTGAKQVCTTVSNPSNAALTPSFCSPAVHGTSTVSLVGNQLCVSYKPNTGYAGQDTVCVKVCDAGGCDSVKIPVTITPSNANCNNTTGIITFTQVGNNATGVFAQRYTLTDSVGKILQIASSKNFTVAQSGLYKVYAVNYDSTQSVTNLSVNQNIVSVAGVCLNISSSLLFRVCLPAPPVITKPVTITVPQDTSAAKTVCTSVLNPNNAPLTLSSCGAPSNGSASVSLVSNQLCISYKPNTGYSGRDTVCVKVCDVGGCDSVKIPITVTPTPIVPPVITKPITSIIIPQDTTGSKQVCTTVSNPSNAALTPSFCSPAGHGTSTFSLVGNQLCVSYKPIAGYSGPDTVCVKVCDIAGCDSIKVPIAITPAAILAPVITKPIAIVVPQDTTGAKQVCTTVSNPSNAALTPSFCSPAVHGTSTVSLVGNQLCVSYKPNTGYAGQDTICVKVCDAGGCDSVKIPVTITPSNANCNNTTGIITFTQVGNNATGVFTQRYTLTDSVGKILQIASSKNFTVAQSGLYKVYAVNYDSTQSVTNLSVNQNIVSVAGVCLNISSSLLFRVCLLAPPIITKPVTITVPQDTSAAKTVCTSVLNPNNAPLTLSSCGAPSNGSASVSLVSNQLCVSYKTNTGYSGRDTVCVKVCDAGGCDSVKIPVTVTPTPIVPPVITKPITSIIIPQDTTGAKQVCTTVSNPSNAPLTLSSCGAPQKGTATVSLTNNQMCISYKPNTGQTGNDTVCVKVCNTGGCDSIKVPVVITPSGTNVSCNNTTGVISFTQSGNNASGVYTQKYVLTDSLGKIGQIVNQKNFTTTQSGLYRVYAVNFDSTQSTSGLTIGQNISGISGACLAVSTPILFRVCLPEIKKVEICGDGIDNDGNGLIDCEDPACTPCSCNGSATTVTFNVSGQNTQLGFVQMYALTNTANKILQISSTKSFLGVNSGQYRIYAVNYNALQGIINFAVNNSIDSVKGSCLNVSKPLLFKNCVSNYCAKLNIKVFLEGPMVDTGDTMHTILNQRGLLPGQTPVGNFATPTPNRHPYLGSPWSYSGSEKINTSYDPTVVDWVLVSLRTDSLTKSSNFLTKSGLLHKDGTIEFLDSCWMLSPFQRYYVVIEHRNHVGVMSPNGFTTLGGDIVHDFTQHDSYTLNNPITIGQKFKNNRYMMLAADGQKQNSNSDHDVNNEDSQIWKTQSGVFDHYLSGDYNLDGDVNYLDNYLWKKNNGFYSGIPK